VDLIQLKTFLEAANCGSFTGASEKLCTSQPAVSRQIVALEKELGLSLFSRHSRGVRLTEAGRCLFQYVEKSLTLLEKAEKALAELRDLESGMIIVGASTTIGNYLLPGWLASFSKFYPKIDVSLQVENSNKVILNVLEGKLDIGLIAGPINSPELCQEYLLDDEVILLVGPEHPWLNEKPIFPESLKQEVLILREPGSATRQAIESHLDKKKIRPAKTIILGNTEAIKKAVIAGMGVTFISKNTVSIELEHGLLYEIKNHKLSFKRPLFAVYPKGVRLSPASLAFLSTIKKLVKSTQ
jgi:DNA-binding transcriptional LysR family regulator